MDHRRRGAARRTPSAPHSLRVRHVDHSFVHPQAAGGQNCIHVQDFSRQRRIAEQHDHENDANYAASQAQQVELLSATGA